MMKITKRVVDAAVRPSEGQTIIWDSEIRGFGLVVRSTGSRSYVFNYRIT